MIILVLVLLGLCLGSFTNALVWRMHERKTRSILTGRSVCPNCHHQLGFWDLIPVFSWLALKGKCRYCHKPYDDTPFAELLVPLIFVLSYLYWPYGWQLAGTLQFGLWLATVVGFVALTVYDMRWQLLPNKLVYPVGFLAIGQLVIMTWAAHSLIPVAGAAIGVLFLGGLFYALFQISGGRWIGGGDVRLGTVIGILVGGPANAILVLFIASVLGTITASPSLLKRKSRLNRRIAFGPFLIAAAVIVYLFGTSLVAWYKNRFLLL
jgi:prepilin signal peptidase PulO-like enzyme (type II secretory pathway)